MKSKNEKKNNNVSIKTNEWNKNYPSKIGWLKILENSREKCWSKGNKIISHTMWSEYDILFSKSQGNTHTIHKHIRAHTHAHTRRKNIRARIIQIERKRERHTIEMNQDGWKRAHMKFTQINTALLIVIIERSLSSASSAHQCDGDNIYNTKICCCCSIWLTTHIKLKNIKTKSQLKKKTTIISGIYHWKSCEAKRKKKKNIKWNETK